MKWVSSSRVRCLSLLLIISLVFHGVGADWSYIFCTRIFEHSLNEFVHNILMNLTDCRIQIIIYLLSPQQWAYVVCLGAWGLSGVGVGVARKYINGTTRTRKEKKDSERREELTERT